MTASRTTRTVARWEDEGGSTYEWPQGTVDNRRSRVLARIRRYGIPCVEQTLTITHEEEK